MPPSDPRERFAITPERRAVNDGFHIGNSADLLAILVRQTVLPSTLVFPVTDRKKTAISTGNSTDSQTTLTTTAGASKTPTLTLAVVLPKTAVASTHSSMTYKKPTTGASSLPTKTDSLVLAPRISNGISTATASPLPSSKTRPTNPHKKNSLTTSSSLSPASAANSTECARVKNSRSSTPSNPR